MLTAALTNPVLLLGVILIIGVLFSDGAERLGVPWVTGCILAGVLFGPDLLGALPRSALSALGGFLQASLAVIAFNIGSRLTVSRLRTIGSSVAWLALAQIIAPLAIVFVAEVFIGMRWQTALIVAAAACVTSPTVTYAVIRRHGASGPFVDRALGILAINDAATILIFSVASSAAVAWLGAQDSGAAIDASVCTAAVNEALSLLVGPPT
jgi:Kef-type K+ transport system membrane component KefB